MASYSLRQRGGRASSRSACPMLCTRASHTAGTSNAMPTNMPGIRPAANRAGTEACGTSTEYTMNAMEGGMRMSVAAPAPTMVAAYGPGYPTRFMAPIMTAPTAAAQAGPEPEMPPRNMATAMVTTGSMPGPRPTMLMAKFTNRDATPERSKMEPTSTNMGMANRGYLASPA